MVRCVNPVTYVQPLAVEFGLDASQNIGDLAGNELLNVLVGAVVIGAVRNCRFDTEGANPGTNQQVRACLG